MEQVIFSVYRMTVDFFPWSNTGQGASHLILDWTMSTIGQAEYLSYHTIGRLKVWLEYSDVNSDFLFWCRKINDQAMTKISSFWEGEKWFWGRD